MSKTKAGHRIPIEQSGSTRTGISQDERQAQEENLSETVSKHGGFANDPDEPTNPNEVRKRHLRKLRP